MMKALVHTGRVQGRAGRIRPEDRRADRRDRAVGQGRRQCVLQLSCNSSSTRNLTPSDPLRQGLLSSYVDRKANGDYSRPTAPARTRSSANTTAVSSNFPRYRHC